jgi:conserved hypothetical protein, ribA/ribD-fused
MTITEKHILFWGDWPSNFAWAPIKIKCLDDVTRVFFSSEQYYMFEKAMYFNDITIADAILHLKFDDEYSYMAKKLGRHVANFDADKWYKVSYDIMLRGCLAKYAQNKVLFDKITDPALEGKKFVEASPYDAIWGIKLGEGDENADDETKWQGENRLGKVLDEVRAKLLAGYKEEIVY